MYPGGSAFPEGVGFPRVIGYARDRYVQTGARVYPWVGYVHLSPWPNRVLTELYSISGNKWKRINYIIAVGNTFSTDGSFDPRNCSICARISAVNAQTLIVTCDAPVRGRYVTVYPNTNNSSMRLCEVKVYGPIIPSKFEQNIWTFLHICVIYLPGMYIIEFFRIDIN